MNTLVIYDSRFGNTEQIARAIADKLKDHGLVIVVPASEAGSFELKEADLVIIGGPTQQHGVSPAMRVFLEGMSHRSLYGLGVAAFDTRYHMAAWKSGSAASKIASRLKRAGATLVLPAESFFVTEREGPLEEGELERAVHWAEQVYEQFEAERSTQKGKIDLSVI